MATIYLEVYRPCYPEQGPKFRALKPPSGKSESQEIKELRDSLSPDMVCVLQVKDVENKEQAIAKALETLAGMPNKVRKVFG